MGLTVQHMQQRLARFEFEALFLEDLGWERLAQTVSPQHSLRALAGLGCSWVLIVSDWATESWPLCTGSRLGLAADQVGTDPLIVAIAPGANRSLWCWRAGATDSAPWRHRVVIRGQGDRAWASRLLRLHRHRWDATQTVEMALNREDRPLTPERASGFHRSWQRLTDALTPLAQVADRRHYALILLTRLIAVAALQQRGYLGGDEWYLHNQFGQSQQRGRDRFFQDSFHPLCQQGFALPLEERPPRLGERLGAIPFVPTGPFRPQPLDQRWGQQPIADVAFETALEWLGDLLMEPATELAHWLPEILEQGVNQRQGAGLVTPEPVLWALGDRTLNAIVLDYATELTGQSYRSVEHLLMRITAPQARVLLEQLAGLTLLDPACGSGRYLLAALHQLVYVAQGLAAIAGLDATVPLPAWVQPSPTGSVAALSLSLYRHFATYSLYGVDGWPPAVELARLQGFLAGVQYTNRPQDLSSLPDLTLTLLPGNSLLGLVTVDSERFDQVYAKGRRSPGPMAQAAPPLQGNLLQPLMADTYQAILAERQVRLEHYHSQTQLLAETGTVPTYAQADFLRDRIAELNQTAQAKLTHLLWSEASQQLGIRVPSPDLTGRRQSRPLTLADVEAVSPFHWGFYLHGLLRDRGGFDLILSHFPGGVVQPTEAGFLETHPDIFQAKQVAPSTFLRNHKQVLTIDPDLTLAWIRYRGQVAWPSQYFRHSGHYPHTGSTAPGQTQSRLYWSRLFLERSLQLLRPGGRCGVMLDPFWAMTNSASLRHWLESQTAIGSVVDLSNHRQLWPDLPQRTTVCLLWLKQPGRTQGCPYSAYQGSAQAPSPSSLGALLQRLIDLAE